MKRLPVEQISEIKSDLPLPEELLEFEKRFRAVATKLHMQILVVLSKLGPQRPRDLIEFLEHHSLDISKNLRKMRSAGILGKERNGADLRSSYYYLKSAEEIGSGGEMIHALLQELLEKIETNQHP